MASTSTPTTPATASHDSTIYKLLFYVPQANTQQCLSAIFATGAGTWPNGPGFESSEPPKYVETCFISQGTGQFTPTEAADPHIGSLGTSEHVQEDRVEMVVVGTERVKRAVAELRKAHPYEVVALFVVKCEDF